MDTVQKVFDDLMFILDKLCKVSHHYHSVDHINDNISSIAQGYHHTILMLACYVKNKDIVKRCLALGADLEITNITRKRGNTALYFAFVKVYDSKLDLEVAELLLQSGANPNALCHGIPIIFKLWNFSYNDLIKSVKLLLSYGAMINNFYLYEYCIERKDLFRSLLAKRRWVIIKCLTLTLSLNKRAVERVNHPDRLKQLGTFEI